MKDLVTDNVKVVHGAGTDALVVTFSGFIPFEKYEGIFKHEFKMIEYFKLKKVLIDLREIKVYAPGAQDLISNVWFPKVKGLGVQFVAIVVPADVFAQASMKKAHKGAPIAGDLQMEHFMDTVSANAWLSKAKAI